MEQDYTLRPELAYLRLKPDSDFLDNQLVSTNRAVMANGSKMKTTSVQQGVKLPPESLFKKAAHGWLLGSQAFVDRVRHEMKSPRFADEVPRARTLAAWDFRTVFAAASDYYRVDQAIFAQLGDGHIARAAAAWLRIGLRITVAFVGRALLPVWAFATGKSARPTAHFRQLFLGRS